MLKESFAEAGSTTLLQQSLVNNFPVDIRTVRQAFDIEADITVYAACPKCSCTYKPTTNGKRNKYPSTCTHRRFAKSKMCGEQLIDNSQNPIRPFAVQDLDSFVGRLICRPGMEDLLDAGTVIEPKSELWDIKDGSVIRDMVGVDQRPFLDGLKRKELRLAWSLSADGFNPYGNKAAGKSASAGSMAMVLLNLPPSLRYKAENMFLCGVIPGPKEPSLDEMNHFLKPVVDQLDISYKRGTHYSKTPNHPSGRSARSALAVVVTDMPGSKRVSGLAGTGSKAHFCSHCEIPLSDLANFDWRSWKPRDVTVLRDQAFAWKNAKCEADRDTIYKAYGVRWSELWRLSYWNPLKMLVIDGMHNIFEGIVAYHIREILGVDRPGEYQRPPTLKEMNSARNAMESDPTAKKLKRFTVAVLTSLCVERGVLIPPAEGKKLKKAPLIDAILAGNVSQFAFEDIISINTSQAYVADTHTSTPHNIIDSDEIIGDAAVDDIAESFDEDPSIQDSDEQHALTDQISKRELKQIWIHLATTTRPSWHRAPPSNLGQPSHGKLKADQWRSAMEFDIPVSIAQMWMRDDVGAISEDARDPARIQHERRMKLARSTLLLAEVMHWATSDVTSQDHADRYTDTLQSYLELIRDLYPDLPFRPNHHSALHLGPFLLRFGPIRGWWMFPFERLIGHLRKINTNNKLGMLL